MKDTLLGRQSVRRMLAAGVSCLALVALSAPVSAAQSAVDRSTSAVSSATTRLQDEPVVPGVRYYLIQTHSNRGTTFEVYNNWDYVLLTNDAGNAGTAQVFEKDGNNYTITSTSSNWGGYNTWCLAGNDIRLDKAADCRIRWSIVPTRNGFYLKVAGTDLTVNNYKKGKGWLSAYERISDFSEFTEFKAVRVE
ncbi:hypothetical protein [Kitasatospora sp. NPDC093102]|uniref:hypothetical protein n=1 Tax=Kitasatospora sp. NPDC093102 TaxID=3155069 RepID=UPI003423428E